MIAAEHKTIIDKGSDFAIRLKVTDAAGIGKDLTDFTASMTIKYDDNGTVMYIDTDGTPTASVVSHAGVITDAVNGELEVIIDKAVTAVIDGRLSADALNIFATQYNFMYSLDILSVTGTEDVRILRGRLAIRN